VHGHIIGQLTCQPETASLAAHLSRRWPVLQRWKCIQLVVGELEVGQASWTPVWNAENVLTSAARGPFPAHGRCSSRPLKRPEGRPRAGQLVECVHEVHLAADWLSLLLLSCQLLVCIVCRVSCQGRVCVLGCEASAWGGATEESAIV